MNGGLVAVGLLEKDTQSDVLWTWVYPSLSAELRQSAMCNCCLTWDGVLSVVPFVYTQSCKRWLYLRTEAVNKLSKVTHVCLVLVCSDFNHHLYASVTQLMLGRYIDTSSPVSVLEAFLQLTTRGCCQSVNNGILSTRDYDARQWAMSHAKVKETVATFGVEFILILTALLLKKRIVVYHSDVAQLLLTSSTLPVFVWHRLNWTTLFPLVHLDNVDELTQSPTGYVAGFMDSNVLSRSDLYDVLVNAEAREIAVAEHAKESFMMGKLHRDLATFIIQTCIEEGENRSNHDCVEAIAEKTHELLTNLRSLGTEDGDGGGRVVITADVLHQKRMPQAAENFLTGLAAAEGLLRL